MIDTVNSQDYSRYGKSIYHIIIEDATVFVVWDPKSEKS